MFDSMHRRLQVCRVRALLQSCIVCSHLHRSHCNRVLFVLICIDRMFNSYWFRMPQSCCVAFAQACVLICFYQDMGPLATSLPPKKNFGRFCCLLQILAPGSVQSFMPVAAGSILTSWKIVERAWTCACIKPKPNQKTTTKTNGPKPGLVRPRA
jgi:hypothetical protein